MFRSKYKATVTGDLHARGEKSLEWQVVKVCMKLKMIDETKVSKELESLKYKVRKDIEELHGKNSRKSRNIVKNLRKEAAKAKKRSMMKYEAKMKHLRRKYRESEENKLKTVPDALAGLGLDDLSIFDKDKYSNIEKWDYEVEEIGDVQLSDNERMILGLPPKFAVEENLPVDGLAHDIELAGAKARMTIAKEEGEKLEEDEEIDIDEEEERKLEKIDAQTRQIYDPIERRFNDQKRRVTDLSECSRVTLPKPLSTQQESMLEMRRGENEKTYDGYRKEYCNKKGDVPGNLSDREKDGLKSLQKRIREKKIIIMKTDKSGKLCVATREEYLRLGKVHTGKDENIERKGIIEIEKQLNGHVFFWAKMWGSGDDHNHRDRIIDSKVVSSEQLADMYLLYKDHKDQQATRPVVTGCNSNTRGFSNCVSDLLESVNKAKENAYESVSSEDMLAKVEIYNQEAEKIRKEGEDKLEKKMRCARAHAHTRAHARAHTQPRQEKRNEDPGKM